MTDEPTSVGRDADAGLYCGSRLRKGEVFACVGLSQNLKDLKDPCTSLIRSRTPPGPYTRPSSCFSIVGFTNLVRRDTPAPSGVPNLEETAPAHRTTLSPRHRASVRTQEEAVSYERGTPACKGRSFKKGNQL